MMPHCEFGSISQCQFLFHIFPSHLCCIVAILCSHILHFLSFLSSLVKSFTVSQFSFYSYTTPVLTPKQLFFLSLWTLHFTPKVFFFFKVALVLLISDTSCLFITQPTSLSQRLGSFSAERRKAFKVLHSQTQTIE